LLGIDRDIKKLKRLEDKDHFGSWTTDFAMMEAHLEQAFRAAKSPAGQECVPPIPMPIPIPKPESLAAPLKQKDGALRPPMKKREIAPEQRLILIVDDNPEARRDLEEKLQQLRYRVVSCGNAAQALMFIETMRFDVCLVDLDMPEINGLELIQKIRDSKTSSDSSIIVVSGSPELFNGSDAIDGGADDYLEKPANALFLQARIRSCLRQSDSRLAELSRFLPEDVAKRVSSNRELLETAVPADISVMVCDIRGFSRVSERVGPMRTIKWISDVMNELSKIILNRGGTIIDYVGDEIMAMWGAPIASQDHATEACRCALAVQKAVAELSEKWLPIVGSPMAVGVGINSGLAVVGNTGSKDRIKFGPLGNTVNMASRVQGATKYLQSSVLITQETAGRIDSNLRGRKICAVRVQNIMEPVELYELSEEGTEEISPKLRLYAEALAAYEKQDLNVAIALLARLMTESPEDGPAKLLMMRVIQSQLGGGTFDPIWTLPGK
jgi:adenylate cyclase